MEIIRDSLFATALLSGIPLFAASIVGLIFGIIQSALQIQETTFLYLIKLTIVITTILIFFYAGRDLIVNILNVALRIS